MKWLRRLLCRHDVVTYHGHPDAPKGLCLDCDKVIAKSRQRPPAPGEPQEPSA